MRYYSTLQASESLQNKLSCVLRTWACQVTKKPTSSTKSENKKKKKKKKNGKKNGKEEKFATLCNLRQLITRNKCNTEKRT